MGWVWSWGVVWSGDTGEGEEPTEGELLKESDNVYLLWASGRVNCTGLLVQLQVTCISLYSSFTG